MEGQTQGEKGQGQGGPERGKDELKAAGNACMADPPYSLGRSSFAPHTLAACTAVASFGPATHLPPPPPRTPVSATQLQLQLANALVTPVQLTLQK